MNLTLAMYIRQHDNWRENIKEFLYWHILLELLDEGSRAYQALKIESPRE